jgi:hypothetical protein
MSGNTTAKQPKYFSDQFDDEEVLFIFRKHPVVMRKGLIFGLLGPLVGVLPAAIHPGFGMGAFFGGLIAGIVLGMIIFFPSWISWHFSVFIVTNQRFLQIKQKGLFARSVSDLSLQQIQSVNYEITGIQETLLGFGTIMMQTYVGNIVIHNVSHPAKTQKKLVILLRDLGINSLVYPGVGVASLENNEKEFEEA